MTILVIVESPAKCKKIEGYLGGEYICIATFGHLRELNNLSEIFDNYDTFIIDIWGVIHNGIE